MIQILKELKKEVKLCVKWNIRFLTLGSIKAFIIDKITNSDIYKNEKLIK